MESTNLAVINETEEANHENKHCKWMFDILKEPRLAEYILLACTQSNLLFYALYTFLGYVKIDDGLLIPEALKIFRESESITLDSIIQDSDKKRALYTLWRTKVIRDNFVEPGLPGSSESSFPGLRRVLREVKKT